MKNFAQVTIYNQRLSVTRIQEVEAYTLNDLFSDIGNYILSVKQSNTQYHGNKLNKIEAER